MKDTFYIIDFDRTLFYLKVDWKELKFKINKLLKSHGKQEIDSSLFNFLYQFGGNPKNELLARRIHKLLKQNELNGIKNGEPLPLLMKLKAFINKSKKDSVLILTNNHQMIVQEYLHATLKKSLQVFGRRSILSPPKDHPVSSQKVKQYLLKHSKDKQLILIGDHQSDRNVASIVNAKFIDSNEFNKKQADLNL